MSTHALRDIARPETKEARKSGFFAGLVEGIGSYRKRSQIEDLLRNPSEEDISASVSAALEKFSSLGDRAKAKVLSSLQGSLEIYSVFTFDSSQKVASVTAIGEFFCGAVKHLPADKNGDRDVAPYERAAYLLRKIADENNLYESGNPQHQDARLACTKALWELDEGGSSFWRERLFDPATSNYAIIQLLSDKEGGWDLLKENLEKTALAIASSRSDKKTEFLAAMLGDTNPEILKISIAASIYLDTIPPEFFERVGEISKLGDELSMWARIFNDACHFKSILVYADDRQFYGAMNLIAMYRSGVNFLPPLLFRIGQEMVDIHQDPAGSSDEDKALNRKKAEEILANLHAAGIRIPGVKIELKG
jgi:hypothetical protein